MPDNEGARPEAAIGWRIRLADDAGADDWLAFSAWLEADPRNGQAYDRIADAERWGELQLARFPVAEPVPVAVNDDAPVARRWRLPAGVAAGLVAAIAGVGIMMGLPTRHSTEFATAPGEHRTIDLADGTEVALNGGTLIRLERGETRHLALVRGEALFTVRHDAARPFEVTAGGLVVRDLGTRFDLSQDSSGTRVAVGSGLVGVASGAKTLVPSLAAGQQLIARDNLVTTAPVASADVGGWQRGRLVFTDASLPQVAAAISRTTGVPVRVDFALASRSFTGLLVVDHDRDALFRRLGPLLGVRAVRDAGGWHWMAPPAH